MTVKVLFVCLGNICRSPTAHGVFQHLLEEHHLSDRITVDSAGTSDWHIGKGPDPRTTEAASLRGYDLSPLRARQVCAADFGEYDYILAMDNANLSDLLAQKPAGSDCHVGLFLDYSELPEREVPDPYYGGEAGFHHVLDLVESASRGLLAAIAKEQQWQEAEQF